MGLLSAPPPPQHTPVNPGLPGKPQPPQGPTGEACPRPPWKAGCCIHAQGSRGGGICASFLPKVPSCPLLGPFLEGCVKAGLGAALCPPQGWRASRASQSTSLRSGRAGYETAHLTATKYPA